MKRGRCAAGVLPCLALALASAQEAPPPDAVPDETALDPSVVATVNDDPVYLEDLERRLNATHSGRAEARRGAFDPELLVESVIGEVLAAQEGRAMEMHLEPPIPQRLEIMRDRLALERLEQIEILDKVDVTEEELRKTFEQDYQTVTMRILTAREREEAEQLMARIEEGEDFEALVAEHSIDQYSGRGGLMENLARKDIPGAIVAAAWQLEPGERTGPVQTSLGWSILQVEGFAAADPERFERLKERLREDVVARESMTLRTRLAQRIREPLGTTIDHAVLDAITVERRPDGRLYAGIEDPAAAVARIGEHVISAEELGFALNKRWKRVRNETAALAAKRLVLERMLRDDLLQIEALRRGYGDTPEVLRRLRAFENEMVATRYFREVVAPRVEIAPEELRAYYDEHLEEFRKPPRVHLGQITVEEEEEAERLAELLRQGTDFTWLARRNSIDGFKDQGGDRGWMTPKRGLDEFNTQVADAAPGDVIGPMGSPGNFMVIQVSAREEQGHHGFDEVLGQIRPIVFRPKFAAYRDDVVGRLRARAQIEINPEVMASLSFSGEQLEESGGEATAPGHP